MESAVMERRKAHINNFALGWLSIAALDGRPRVRTVIRCPFHSEKTGSCIVTGISHDEEPYITRGEWRCFGCGRRGAWDSTQHTKRRVGYSGIDVPETIMLQSGSVN